MELRVQDLILYCRTVKEMWTYLGRLYAGDNHLSRAHNVIQKLFRSKQDSQMLTQFYVDFNKLM